MELVRKIDKNKFLSIDYGIYKLSEDQQKKFGNKYAVTQGVYSRQVIENINEDELLSDLKSYCYEGFFETEREAILHIKLIEMNCKVARLVKGIADIQNTLLEVTDTSADWMSELSDTNNENM